MTLMNAATVEVRSDAHRANPTSRFNTAHVQQDSRTLLIAISPASPYHAPSIRPMKNSLNAFELRAPAQERAVHSFMLQTYRSAQPGSSFVRSGLDSQVFLPWVRLEKRCDRAGTWIIRRRACDLSLIKSATSKAAVPTERAAPSSAASLTEPRCSYPKIGP